jgi:hypothetical protein
MYSMCYSHLDSPNDDFAVTLTDVWSIPIMVGWPPAHIFSGDRRIGSLLASSVNHAFKHMM